MTSGPDEPVIIIVGGDALALGTAQELCVLQGHHVVVLWRRDPDFARAVETVGAVFIAGQPDTPETLAQAGVARAITILALSGDDQLNLHAALLARDANPGIRDRPSSVQSPIGAQDRAESAGLLGSVAGLAFGGDLRGGGARCLLLSRPAVSGAGWTT